MGFSVRDQDLIKTQALPSGAASVETGAIDLGHSTSGTGDFVADCEAVLTAPALTNAQLGSGHTMTYRVEMDNDSDFGSPTVIATDAIVQTGDGSGADAATKRIRLPLDVERYIRAVATASHADDASGASMTLDLRF